MPRADSGWWLVIPLVIAGCGLGLLVSQLNNYTLAPIDEERISEAAGVNSAGGSFGLSFGLALGGALMMGTLALTFTKTHGQLERRALSGRGAAGGDRPQGDTQVMRRGSRSRSWASRRRSRLRLIRIDAEAQPIALQAALLVPLFAGLLGLIVSLGMMRQKDVAPSAAVEGLAFG